MNSFCALYADVQLCILAFLPVRDLLAVVRLCKSLVGVVARVRVTNGVELKPVRDEAATSIFIFLPPLLPEPHWTLRHLVTSVQCNSVDLLQACDPHTLRDRCPDSTASGCGSAASKHHH